MAPKSAKGSALAEPSLLCTQDQPALADPLGLPDLLALADSTNQSTSGCVAVACSGGQDSTALLHATWRWARQHGWRLLALHVNHGLNPQADDWRRHVQTQCQRWSRQWPIEFHWRAIGTRPAAGESIEAWARVERYAALREMALAAGTNTVLLAHHRRDQAETFLLQALRGAGAAGLSAMPKAIFRDGIHWLRPWLSSPASAVAHYVQRWRLSHIEDDSNASPRYARNRLRHEVWPQLLKAFPEAETSFCQSTHQAQKLRMLIQEVVPPALLKCQTEGSLQLGCWRELSEALRWFVLKAWLEQSLRLPVPDKLLAAVWRDLPSTSVHRWLASSGQAVRRYRDALWIEDGQAPLAEEASAQDGTPSLATDAQLLRPPGFLQGPGAWELPAWQGILSAQAVPAGGLPWPLLQHAWPDIRRPGDRLALQPLATPRSLKKQFQALAVPAWQRSGPCLRCADENGRTLLLWVAGLGPHAPLAIGPGASLRWEAAKAQG